jgi:hypothetical protein
MTQISWHNQNKMKSKIRQSQFLNAWPYFRCSATFFCQALKVNGKLKFNLKGKIQNFAITLEKVGCHSFCLVFILFLVLSGFLTFVNLFETVYFHYSWRQCKIKMKWNSFKNSSLKKIKNKNTKLYLVWKLPFAASDSAKKF